MPELDYSSANHVTIYKIKEFVQPKMSLNNGEFFKREGEGRGGGWAGQQAGIFMVSLGLGKIER